MWKKIAEWYEGRWVPYENPPGSQVIFFGGNHERHWTARVARILVEFWLAHWQWTIGFALAVIGLWATLRGG